MTSALTNQRRVIAFANSKQQFAEQLIWWRHTLVRPYRLYLPNNHAANLINFWKKTHLHNLIRTYTFINFEVIFYLHVYSDLHDYLILRKFPTCTFIFMSMIQMFDLKQTQLLFITLNITYLVRLIGMTQFLQASAIFGHFSTIVSTSYTIIWTYTIIKFWKNNCLHN